MHTEVEISSLMLPVFSCACKLDNIVLVSHPILTWVGDFSMSQESYVPLTTLILIYIKSKLCWQVPDVLFHLHHFSHPHGSNAAVIRELWNHANWGTENRQDPLKDPVEFGSGPVAMIGWRGWSVWLFCFPDWCLSPPFCTRQCI